MLKMLGAVMILVASTSFGFFRANQYVNRPKQIRQLHHALQRLETEIAYGATPLPDALGSISRQCAEPIATLLAHAAAELGKDAVTTAEAWRQALEATWHRTAFRAAELEIMTHLGGILGASDRIDQIKHLQLAMRGLQIEEEASLEEQLRYAKMWRSLGLLGGALVVILVY